MSLSRRTIAELWDKGPLETMRAGASQMEEMVVQSPQVMWRVRAKVAGGEQGQIQ